MALALVLITVFVSSCKKTETLSQQDTVNKDEKLYAELLNGGVKAENIKDLGEYYLVEGDMMFKKNKTDIAKVSAYFNATKDGSGNLHLETSAGGNGKIASVGIPNKISQWRSANLVSSSNVENIKVYNDYPYGANTLWGSAWSSALNNWASISNCKINFIMITLIIGFIVIKVILYKLLMVDQVCRHMLLQNFLVLIMQAIE